MDLLTKFWAGGLALPVLFILAISVGLVTARQPEYAPKISTHPTVDAGSLPRESLTGTGAATLRWQTGGQGRPMAHPLIVP